MVLQNTVLLIRNNQSDLPKTPAMPKALPLCALTYGLFVIVGDKLQVQPLTCGWVKAEPLDAIKAGQRARIS